MILMLLTSLVSTVWQCPLTKFGKGCGVGISGGKVKVILPNFTNTHYFNLRVLLVISTP
jgi:hypothetical protein